MTKEEKQKIVDMVIEEVMVQMPDVIGNLMKNHAKLAELNHAFYTKHPEFQQHKDIVCATIEQIEGTDLSLKYEDILKQASPLIKERIKLIDGLEMGVRNEIPIPNTIEFDLKGNGLI